MKLPLLPTGLVGSWAQPGWLVDRNRLEAHLPVRTRAALWRVDPEHLEEAQRDAVALACTSKNASDSTSRPTA